MDKLPDKQPIEFQEGQSVELVIGDRSDLGYKAMINNSHHDLSESFPVGKFVFETQLISKAKLIGQVVNFPEHVEGVELFEAIEIVEIHVCSQWNDMRRFYNRICQFLALILLRYVIGILMCTVSLCAMIKWSDIYGALSALIKHPKEVLHVQAEDFEHGFIGGDVTGAGGAIGICRHLF